MPLFGGTATPPALDDDRAFGRSVIGGYVYRGTMLPAMFRGRYFFGDFGSGRVWSAGPVPNGTPGSPAPSLLEHTAELGGPLAALSSFARDLDGELYVLSVAGEVRKIVPARAVGAPTEIHAEVSGTTVRLAWTAAAGPTPAGYTIEAGSAPGLSDIARITVGATTSHDVPGVPPGRYYVRVRALSAAGESAPSPEAVAFVGLGCTAPPGPPTGLTATLAGRQVSLT